MSAAGGPWPRISIVTPSYNQAAYLESALCSVLEQGYPDLELFVLDGGSTDGSLEILKRLGDELNYWESVPDEGQSHAIEKGMSRATGVLVNWLNSDDLLLPGALFRVARAYLESRADVIVGEDLHFEVSPEEPVFRFRPLGYSFPACLRFWDGGFRYHQPCTFVTRALYQRVGGVDRTLHYVMDYDLYCRMLAIPGVKTEIIAEPLTAFRLHPSSKTRTKKREFLEEQARVSRRYWAQAGFDEGRELAGLRRYRSHCAAHRLAESVRRGDLLEAARCACEAASSPSGAMTAVLGAARRRRNPT